MEAKDQLNHQLNQLVSLSQPVMMKTRLIHPLLGCKNNLVKDLDIEPELQDVIHKTLTERRESKKREEGRIDSEERERQRRATKDLERKNREKYEREKKEYERKDRERKELEKKQFERKEIERKIREIRKRDPKKEDEKSRPAPRSSDPPQQPAETPHWIRSDGTLKPFKEIHKMSQWSEEGSTEVYVSCLRCQKTIKGAESYSLWAHVESKRCYPENAIKGWRQQAKEKEQQAKIDEAYRATAKEAARKMSKGRGQHQYLQSIQLVHLLRSQLRLLN